MSSAVHSDRAKEQIVCKVFTQSIKHTAAQSKLSVPLFFIFVIDSAWKKGPGHSKQRQSRGSPSYLAKYFHRNLVQLHGRRIKTTPLQILDHALPYLLLWQSPMHCAVRCIFTYALGTGVAHIFAKFSAVEQCVRHSKELHRLYDRGT